MSSLKRGIRPSRRCITSRSIVRDSTARWAKWRIETPGVSILHFAHRAVESLTMDREVMHLRDGLIPRFSELIYNGFWFSPEMGVMKAFIEETQKGINGTARIKLFKG